MSCCYGWRIRSYATNGRAAPTRNAAPPAVKAGWSRHPKAVVVVLVPGMGRFLIEAIFHRDYAVVQAVIVLITVTVLAVNVVLDLAYAWLNPRIRYT